MSNRDLLVLLLLVVIASTVGTIEWIIEIQEPGVNVVTAFTTAAVGWVFYRLGKGSGDGEA